MEDQNPFSDFEKYFILGGTGSGKGTLCDHLTEKLEGVRHFSAGDLLREEQERGGEHSELIKEYIREGKIVPAEITIALLRNAMLNNPAQTFLIDGFPRAIDQAECFERLIAPGKAVIFLTCTEDVMRERILGRGRVSGRIDDNLDSLIKRFHVFHDVTLPVIEMFELSDRVMRVDATRSPLEVYESVSAILAPPTP